MAIKMDRFQRLLGIISRTFERRPISGRRVDFTRVRLCSHYCMVQYAEYQGRRTADSISKVHSYNLDITLAVLFLLPKY